MAEVRVAKAVFAAARRARAEHGREWAVQLLLRPTGPGAAAAVRESVDEVARERQVPGLGAWEAVEVADGVRIQVADCDDFDADLPRVVAALERRGIGGRIGLWTPPAPAVPPATGDMLAAHLRVVGERVRREPGWYEWHGDPAALDAVLAAAQAWCFELGADAEHALQYGTIDPVRLEPGEDAVERMAHAVAGIESAVLSSVRDGQFRCVVARPPAGGISLLAGPASTDDLERLVDVLRAEAERLVYGSVRRGWSISETVAAPLGSDWPVRPGGVPRGPGWTSEAFEDLVAPDAFGVLLLGPGHADPAAGAPWTSEAVGAGRTLLRHRDPDAWFGAQFVPVGSYRQPEDRPVPEVLARARDELARVLYAPGRLADYGVGD